MQTLAVQLGLAGLIFGFLGSGLLAFSLNRVVAALSFAADAHELAINGLLESDPRVPIVWFHGTDEHVKRGQKRAGKLTWLGLWMLVLSFGLQAAGLLLTTG